MSCVKNVSEEDKIINSNIIDTNSNDILCNNNSDTVSNVKIDDTETKLYGKTSKKSTSNNIIKNRRIGSDKSGFKSIVHKVMSWNNRISNSHKDKTNITNQDNVPTLKNLKLQQDESDENLCKADWLRAKDSLENLLLNRDLNSPDLVASKSASMPFRKSNETTNEQNDLHPKIKNCKNASAHSISKVLAWDPWDKLGKKSKRENKRRKEKVSKDTSYINGNLRKDVTSGDEIRDVVQNANENAEESYENYQYQPYCRAKNVKSVDFTNEVRVVYFNADEVIGECNEPLKKELDQQIRNKEMRRGHCPTMLIARRNDEYVSSVYKK